MIKIDQNRKMLNKQQTRLRELLTSKTKRRAGLDLFRTHHSMLHAQSMSGFGLWSYEDVVFEGLSDEEARTIPDKQEHSIAWMIWHLARIEDVTMNCLVADSHQCFTAGNWQAQLNVSMVDTGNGMTAEMIRTLSGQIDVAALREYRSLVGRRTQEIVRELSPDILPHAVEPNRLQRVLDEGAVLPEGIGVVEYWGRRNIAGLLLMPPTRHCIIHLNEAYALKKKLK
jgi:hypothetical protein